LQKLLRPLQRLISLGGSAVVSAAGTKLGLSLGTTAALNTDLKSMIKNSIHANPQPERIPSPDPFMIPSPLEDGQLITSPLQDFLVYSLVLDIFIFILFIIILTIIFNRYVLKFNFNFINFILNKYMSANILNLFNNYITTQKLVDYHSKYILMMFIINSFFIFFFIFLKLFILSQLITDIDGYILVHNYLHSKN